MLADIGKGLAGTEEVREGGTYGNVYFVSILL